MRWNGLRSHPSSLQIDSENVWGIGFTVGADVGLAVVGSAVGASEVGVSVGAIVVLECVDVVDDVDAVLLVDVREVTVNMVVVSTVIMGVWVVIALTGLVNPSVSAAYVASVVLCCPAIVAPYSCAYGVDDDASDSVHSRRHTR